MSLICPSILAGEPHEYREQIERVTSFAMRIQVDLMDGEFAPTKSINVVQAWWPDGILADIHLMFKRPLEQIETLVSLKPNLVIIHAEAEGDLVGMLDHLKKFGIKTGVCLLKDTSVDSAKELIAGANHVLLFSGNLGHFGGVADLKVLEKIPQIKAINPNAEIGWDGGANESNAAELARAGVDIINVGGAIQKSENPEEAYATLNTSING